MTSTASLFTGHYGTSPKYTQKFRKLVSETDKRQIFLQNVNRKHVHLLNVCQLGRSAVVVLLSCGAMRHLLSQ